MITVKNARRIWAVLVLCCLFLSFAQTACARTNDAAAQTKSAVWYAKKSTKMYEKKNVDSDVVAKIPAGAAVTVIKMGSWCKVSYSGNTGFVKKARLRKTEAEEEPKVQPVTKVYDIEKLRLYGIYGETVDGVDHSGLTKLDQSKEGIPSWYGKIVLGEGGMAVPILYQFDFAEVVCVYNGVARSVATSGCGATSLSMIISYITGNTEQSPYTLFREACQDKMYSGDGLGHSALTKLAKRYGVKGVWKNLTADELISTLSGGTPVIAHMGNGYFTKNGHYIVLRGVTKDGMILVNDPASAERSMNAYPIEIFMKEKRAGSAFMVTTKIEVAEKEDALVVPATVSDGSEPIVREGTVTPAIEETVS